MDNYYANHPELNEAAFEEEQAVLASIAHDEEMARIQSRSWTETIEGYEAA